MKVKLLIELMDEMIESASHFNLTRTGRAKIIEIKKRLQKQKSVCPVYTDYEKYGKENIIAFSDLCNRCIELNCKYNPKRGSE